MKRTRALALVVLSMALTHCAKKRPVPARGIKLGEATVVDSATKLKSNLEGMGLKLNQNCFMVVELNDEAKSHVLEIGSNACPSGDALIASPLQTLNVEILPSDSGRIKRSGKKELRNLFTSNEMHVGLLGVEKQSGEKDIYTLEDLLVDGHSKHPRLEVVVGFDKASLGKIQKVIVLKSAVSDEIARRGEDLDRIAKTVNKRIDDLANEFKAHKDAFVLYQANIATQLTNLVNEDKKLDAKITTQIKWLSGILRGEIAGEKKDRENAIKGLEKLIADLRTDLTTEKGRIDTLSDLLKKLKESHEKLDKDFQDYKTAQVAAAAKIEERVKSLEASSKTNTQGLKEAKASLAMVIQDVNRLDASVGTLTGDYKTLKAAVEKLKTDSATKTELKDELKKLEDALKVEIKAKVDAAKDAAKKDAAESLKVQVDRIDAIAKDVKDAKEAIKNLKDGAASDSERLDLLEVDVDDLLNKILPKMKEDAKKALDDKVKELEGKIRAAKDGAKADVKQDIDALAGRVKEAEQGLDDLVTAHARMKNVVFRLKKADEENDGRIDTLETQIQDLTDKEMPALKKDFAKALDAAVGKVEARLTLVENGTVKPADLTPLKEEVGRLKNAVILAKASDENATSALSKASDAEKTVTRLEARISRLEAAKLGGGESTSRVPGPREERSNNDK